MQQDSEVTRRAAAVESFSEIDVRARSLVDVLSNGLIHSVVTAAGTGRVTYNGVALNRWLPDPTTEDDGIFLYVRDLDDGRYWSASLQPDVVAPDEYEVTFVEGLVRIERLQHGIRSVLKIFVAEGADAEVRRLTLRNEDTRARRLDVTSFVEIVLNDAEADHAHPAFSKLFVQTAYDPGRHAVRAWRRRRSPDERPAHLIHALLGEGHPDGFETSRPHFLGRARSNREPLALTSNAAFEGLVGSVLDPVAVLRRNLSLAPGEQAIVVSILGAARTEEDLYPIVDALLKDPAAAVPARAPASEELRRLGALAAVRQFVVPPAAPAIARPAGASGETSVGSSPDGRPPEALRFDNGYGGFSEDGREYVIRMPIGTDGRPALPPQPWTNVIANEDLGFFVSETGASCTWSGNSREHRLTPWLNDPVADPHTEALYLRDEDAGEFWSPLPGPTPAPAPYETRHGLGFTTFRHTSADLEQETTQFVVRTRPVKVTRVRLRNLADRPRTLSLFQFVPLVLGSRPDQTRPHLDVAWDDALAAIVARNDAGSEYSGREVFVAARGPGEVFHTTDRTAFVGRLGNLYAPRAVTHERRLSGESASAFDPCAALQLRFSLPPNDEASFAFFLGDVGSRDEMASLLDEFGGEAAWNAALEEVRDFWDQTTGRLQLHTPSPEIDLMVNAWLPYQNLSCRMWGRTAFYQSGGAFGFRDQLQDSAGLLYLDPGITRRQILLHASNQFVEGDVMHWWHPPTGKGIRTRFSDDLLWLPYVAAFYVRATGDGAVLDEQTPYLTARALEPGEDEVFLKPEPSGTRGSVYEHCCRAIDRSLATGAHGLPLMGTGDWNDGMNRVGREGRGESVWLGFFLYHVLGRFLPFCEARGDAGRAAEYTRHREALRGALNDAGWDGDWYRRAYYDDGNPLGASENDECRIDALAQAWSVISGAAPPDRAAAALDAMERELVDERAGIIRLLTPAFDRTTHDPGYIKGYVPGVRENGGQYTHGVLWAIRALAEADRGERAARLLKMLSPVSHADTREGAERYRVELYVVAADVYGEPPHVGRGGWTWYTGSAAWMYRVAIESIVGFRLENGTHVVLDPSIPSDWPSVELRYGLPDGSATYEIVLRNPDARTRGIRRAIVDGHEISCDGGWLRVEIVRDGGLHRIDAEL